MKRFSIRQVTIAGTLISAVGFIASIFAPNVFVLIVMYGVVGGESGWGTSRLTWWPEGETPRKAKSC